MIMKASDKIVFVFPPMHEGCYWVLKTKIIFNEVLKIAKCSSKKLGYHYLLEWGSFATILLYPGTNPQLYSKT